MSKIKSELIMRGEFFSLFLLQSWFLSNLSCDIPCYLFPADRLYIEDGNGWWSEKWIPKAAFFLMATRRQHLRLGGGNKILWLYSVFCPIHVFMVETKTQRLQCAC